MNIFCKIENDTGLKAKDIAKILGITRSYYSRINVRIHKTVSLLVAVAAVLGGVYWWFFLVMGGVAAGVYLVSMGS